MSSMVDVLLVAGVRLHGDALAALMRQHSRMPLRVTVTADHDMRARLRGTEVIVLDASAPEAQAALREAALDGSHPIVAIGVGDEAAVLALAEAGVIGFVDRDAGVDALLEAIENALRGEATCPPRIASALLRRVTGLARTEPPATSALTLRERQIVQLIEQDLSNKEIASRLCIEVATVKNHVHNILEKLQVSRRGEAVARMRLIEGGRSGQADPQPRTRFAEPAGSGRAVPFA